ncbi:MAG: hypothetical protein CFE23_09600 [Flavobacterium sp. BFFFF1]|uniref:sensor histidine kinase n=1 Tax=Flavobacterium sp. BFFFF1 TaxID=2015557 RepID=UPI000BD3DBBD|nr:histidine kinase [Flavobacterium sp. BFFFF1]OYU80312.1 MAG: hypothetical protein CFE23_09600 [Flavobacterium sp. BFFFF1]
MKKSFVFVIHLGFWVAYFFLLFVILAAATMGFSSGISPGYLAKVGFSFAVLPPFITFYLCYCQLFPKYIQTNKTGLSLVYGVLYAVGAALVGGLSLSLFFGSGVMFKDGSVSFLSEIACMSLIGLAAGIMGIILKGFINWYDEIKLKEALLEKNTEIELALVKAQLDPHFLFNTINNIDALILRDPKVASEYLNKLSEILRFMLFETKTEAIALSKEIEYIEKYIALQKTRTLNDNFVRFTLSGSIAHQMISPMVLIPFIENAFKHTGNKKAADAITISLAVTDKKIVFECQNKYSDNNKSQIADHGIGNDLIRKRIALLYPGKHDLSITNVNQCYKVTLTLTHD